MDINKVTEILLGVFNLPSTPLTPMPPPILLTGANMRPGLSARNIAARIIARQSEAGAPVGALADGSQNVAEAMEVIRVEEIISAVFLYPIFVSIIPAGIPMNRYARKFIMLPIIPSTLEPSYALRQIVPNGAARFVTNDIMAKRKNIVIMAIRLPFFA
jgi:hypothetical protein